MNLYYFDTSIRKKNHVLVINLCLIYKRWCGGISLVKHYQSLGPCCDPVPEHYKYISILRCKIITQKKAENKLITVKTMRKFVNFYLYSY